jgi:Fe-S cluster assembly ATPase SufC
MLVAQDSRCLLLDEPTSALDIAHQVDVLALVHRLSEQRGSDGHCRAARYQYGGAIAITPSRCAAAR